MNKEKPQFTDKDGKPVPRVEKYKDKAGNTVTRFFEVFEDIQKTIPTEEDILKAQLKLTHPRDVERLRKHFSGESLKPDKTKKIDKPFPEYLINLKDKRELFAENLRSEFSTGKGLQIRYMIEALTRLNLLTLADRERAGFYKSLQKYFNRDIGKIQGIFNKKESDLHKANIESALTRVNAILENLFPAK